jgi:hypothetical protein
MRLDAMACCILPAVMRALRGLGCATWWTYVCLCVLTGSALAEPHIAVNAGIVLSVTPIPNQTKPSLETPQVTWSTGNGSPGNVTITSDSPKEMVIAYGSEGTNQEPWLASVKTYVLRLYSIAPRRKLLARLRVGRETKLEVVGRPLAPKETSPAIDRILQLVSIGWIAVGVLLASMFVIETRRGH